MATADRADTLIADATAAMLANPGMAVDRAFAAERLARSMPPSNRREIMQATAQWLRGEANIRLERLAIARPIIAQALATAGRIAPRTRLHADLLLSSGGINTVSGDVGQALADYQGAHSIYVKLGEVRSQSKALQSIGSLYGSGNDYANALKYYDQALAAYRGDPNLLLSLYNNRGNAYKELGRFDAAEAQYREALLLAERMDSPLLRMLVLSNIAEGWLGSKRLDLAARAISQAGAVAAAGPDTAALRMKLVALSAQLALQRRDYPLAKSLIDRRFAREDLSRTTLMDREAHRTAYHVYAATGRNDLALPHLAALKRIDDEATKLARSTNAALMGARFDFANQELKIAKLRQDELQRNVAYERASAQTQRTMFLGAAVATMIVIALLIFALFTSRRSRATVQAANADLAVTNDALGKALAAKTEFLATTSHEIRTPLNGILGMTQVMLADATLPAPTRDRISVVHGAGVTMRALVDDILDVAKMETGNLTIEAAPFDLRATIAESTRLWDDQAVAKGLAFVRRLDACPTMIEGDSARLRQIVFNLLSNALKFTASGEVSLTIAPYGDDRYRILVADTGIGIPAEKREEIFESFRQADAGTTRQFGGTGLGLSICRNLARAMGGEVTVESVAGEGTTFVVDLPLIRVAASTASASDDEAAPGLLIVDRNPITRSMLKTLFAPRFHRIELVGSIDDAIAAVDRGSIARVLIDDGAVRAGGEPLTDLRRLAEAAEGQGVGVALLWPVSSPSERAELLATGIGRVIAKPITGAALVAAMFCDPATSIVDPPLVPQAA
ncbi:ATP-binding protein [Sphingomonas sp. Tas61C01]|uniref:ATP-binding protein n=1 Tax=Sphingomonas sp. Tas61C01 TaxID=3458297 RepID=UPI00403ED2AA